MNCSANLPSAIFLKRAISFSIGLMSRYFSSLWHSGAFCCLLTCGKRRIRLCHQLGEFLEFAAAPALRHAAEAGHALRHIGLEADALLLAVIADVDAGRDLLVDHMAYRLVHLGGHLLGVECLAGFLAHQQVGQLLVARQAADMGGQNAVPAEDHERVSSALYGRTICFALQRQPSAGIIRIVLGGKHNGDRRSACGRTETRLTRWAKSHATTISPPMSCKRNLDAGRANKPAYIDARGTYDLWPARRPGGALRRRAARPRRQARGARADGAHRHHRLADRVSRLPQGRHHRGAGQHAADRGRLPLHAGRQPRQMPGGVGGAVSEIREAHQAKPRPRARHRLRRQSARLPAVRGSHRRRRAGRLHRADHLRRHGVLALHLGLHRQAEGRGACAMPA